ncbi:hypothetical protein [Massilia luteola]|uniref:hypothetical protein n=1 Tax=Massilia luteola TaxID=3081751 RepID=UPI002ACC31E0|nr:hypothetical protein [Massilia sp. Gc5]
MRHAPSLAACAACGLALLLAWLALQPYAAPVPTGPFLPGYGSERALAHVRALAQAPRPAGLPPLLLPLTGTTVAADVLRFR